MRTRLAILGGLALALFAEEPSAEARAPAVTLLDRAEASVAAVSPAIQASALLHLADTWYAFDSKKGAALADRAFEASLLLPPDERGDYPARLVELLAGTSLDKALALSRRIPAETEGRASAITAVVKALIGAMRAADAASLIGSLGTDGEYPYAGVRPSSRRCREIQPPHQPSLAL